MCKFKHSVTNKDVTINVKTNNCKIKLNIFCAA